MATIQDFTGIQYIRSAKGTIEGQAYQNNNYQYASSSHQVDHDMNPALIVQPTCDADIIAALKYAKAKQNRRCSQERRSSIQWRLLNFRIQHLA
jgi:hypothetical protein